MTGSITLDTPLEGCTPGEQKELRVLVTATANDSSGFKATVDEVLDYEEAGEEMAEGETETESAMGGKMAGKRAGMEKHAPAVAIVIGAAKPKKGY